MSHLKTVSGVPLAEIACTPATIMAPVTLYGIRGRYLSGTAISVAIMHRLVMIGTCLMMYHCASDPLAMAQ
jgi:hypothetical protein